MLHDVTLVLVTLLNKMFDSYNKYNFFIKIETQKKMCKNI